MLYLYPLTWVSGREANEKRSAECFQCNYLGKTESFYQIVTCLSYKILRKFYFPYAPLYYALDGVAILSTEDYRLKPVGSLGDWKSLSG